MPPSPRTPRSAASPKKVKPTDAAVGRWTTAEEAQLKKLVKELQKDGKKNWSSIATLLGTKRTAQAVAQHWKLMNVLDRGATPKKTAAKKPAKSKKMLLMGAAAAVVAAAAVAVKVYVL